MKCQICSNWKLHTISTFCIWLWTPSTKNAFFCIYSTYSYYYGCKRTSTVPLKQKHALQRFYSKQYVKFKMSRMKILRCGQIFIRVYIKFNAPQPYSINFMCYISFWKQCWMDHCNNDTAYYIKLCTKWNKHLIKYW